MIKDTIQAYCTAHGLTFVTNDELSKYWGGAEEWEGVDCAGIDAEGTPYIVLELDGTIKVVTQFADGVFRMQDAWKMVTVEEVSSGWCLHAV